MGWPTRRRVFAGLLAAAVALHLFQDPTVAPVEKKLPKTLKLIAPTGAQFQASNLSLAAPPTAALQAAKPPLAWTSEELGVFHYLIPGEYNSSANGTFGVVMHIMVKVVSNDADGMKIIGTGFAEQAEPSLFRHKAKERGSKFLGYIIHMTQPEDIELGIWQPRIWLQALDGKQHEFEFAKYSEISLPFALNLELTQADGQGMGSAQLRVDDWQTWYEVSPQRWAAHLKPGSLVSLHRPPPLPDGLRRVVLVQAYMWGATAAAAAPLIVQSLQYHLRLGVHSVIIYALAGLLQSLSRCPEAVAAIRAGQLRVVDWHREFPQYDGLRGQSDQPSMTTHAVLAYHNEDVVLLLADTDEVLVSFRPLAPLQLAELVRNISGDYSRQVTLPRVEALCSDCYGSAQTTRHAAPGEMSKEMALWTNSNMRNLSEHPLLHYQHLLRNSTAQMQLLPDPNGKSFADPSRLVTFGVHWGQSTDTSFNMTKCGFDWPGSFDVDGVRVPPLLILHLVKLHALRGPFAPWDQQHWMRRTEWQWPLQQA